MNLDTAIREDAQHTHVVVRGQASLGQLSSLMHVLEVDSRSWRHDCVLLDFSALDSRVESKERKLLEQIAEVRLRKKQLAFVWPQARGL
jgi:hypothetical protein